MLSRGREEVLQEGVAGASAQPHCQDDACCSTASDDPPICQSETVEKHLASDADQSSQSIAYFPAANSPEAAKSSDLESLSNVEHVTIEIQGSNCPGCIRKISKALESMPFLHNVQLRTIPLQAEFDLEVSRVSVRETIRSFQSRTGRQCESIGDGWQILQVIVPRSCANLEDSVLPFGVMDIKHVGKNRFSIKYDARKIGARHLIQALKAKRNCLINLAPAESYDGMPVDIRQAGRLTLISLIFTLPILILAWAPLPKQKTPYEIASLVLATVVQIVVAGPFYPKALRSLFLHKVIDMDLLVVLSTSITYTLSVASFICEAAGAEFASGMYFETSTLLIT